MIGFLSKCPCGCNLKKKEKVGSDCLRKEIKKAIEEVENQLLLFQSSKNHQQ
jgi:hypothetical protein